MSLIDVLSRRGSIPSVNEAQRMKAGGDMPPMRGVTPWSNASGFEAHQKQVLQELLATMAARDPASQQSIMRLMPFMRK